MAFKFDLKDIGSALANVAEEAGKAVTDAAKVASNEIVKTAESIDVKKMAEQATSFVKLGADKASEVATKIMDVNGDGQVDIEDIIIMGLRIPGIGVNREEFLRAEFRKDFPQEIIDDAILNNPAHAGICPN